MEKKTYEEVEIQTICFEAEDIVTASGGGQQGCTRADN